MKKRKNAKGFSLFELMVVVGIIAVLTAIGVPMMSHYLSTWRLNASGRDLYNSLMGAKNSAIRYNSQVVVEFTPAAYAAAGGVGSYRVYVDTDRDWTDQDASGQPEQVLLVPSSMPARISLYSSPFTNNGNGRSTARTMAGFDSRGRAARAIGGTFVSGEVYVRNDQSRYQRVVVTPVGSLFIEKSADGVNWER